MSAPFNPGPGLQRGQFRLDFWSLVMCVALLIVHSIGGFLRTVLIKQRLRAAVIHSGLGFRDGGKRLFQLVIGQLMRHSLSA